LQNRILTTGNVCACDPSRFYDDGSLICPQCYFTCASCTGPTVSECTACNAAYFRVLATNTCSCMSGYYDSGVQICSPCSYTCTTCSNNAITGCLSCNVVNNRILLGNGTCSCIQGFYDNSTNSPMCAPCLYSCQSC